MNERIQELISSVQIDPDVVIELGRALIRVPSHTPEGEKEAAAVLEAFLQQAEVPIRRQTVDDVGVNVIGTLPSASGEVALLFNGHLDTVPPSSAMRYPAFEAIIQEGQLWGRGSVDMKSGIAAMASALAAVHTSGIRLKRSIALSAVACEEKGNRGTETLLREGISARSAVVGEATGLDVVIAHKGVDRYQIHLEGIAAHESMPERGVNAIIDAAHVIAAMDRNLFPRAQSRMHPILGCATYNIGTIQGGINRNSIPDHCMFQISKRWLPGDSPEAIRAELEEAIREVGPRSHVSVVREQDMDRVPHMPLDLAPDHPLVRRLASTIADVTGRYPALMGIPAFTDAALLQAAGIPALIFGPGYLELAHSDQERVLVSQMITAARVYAAFAIVAATRDDG
jgi:succinyl-diaminopimelate desuccinylase